MLSEILRLIRVYHDLNQTEAAEKLKISKSYLSEIEAGIKAPTLPLLESYAAEFQIPMSAILFFSENYDGDKTANRARRLVSNKALRLLHYIEERSKAGK